MNNYQKYIKYKKKYLSLKNQIAGSGIDEEKEEDFVGTIPAGAGTGAGAGAGAGIAPIPSVTMDKSYYLPCEIDRFTHRLFLNESVYYRLGLIENENINKNIVFNDAEYCQDPAIFFKNLYTGTNYAIQIKIGLNLDLFGSNVDKLNEYFSPTGNDYGGNFISSPTRSTINPHGVIFCFDGITPILQNKIESLSVQKLVQLSCSFRYNGERHIDECMCFMPYGDRFKIWFYKIRNITYSYDTNRFMHMSRSITKEHIDKKLETLKNLFTKNNFLSENMDFITFIKKRLSQQELLAYYNYYEPSLLYNYDLDEFSSKLELERQHNLELISQNLFLKSYEEVKSNFVFFPIDLEVDIVSNNRNCKIKNIPIFNRVWHETEDRVNVLFSYNGRIDPEIYNILRRERPNVKSILNPKKEIDFIFYNTEVYNNSGNVGGNIHCLIKSLLT